MINNSSDFQKNRKKEVREQFNYWSVNIESGILRLLERVLLRFNVSDILAGNLGQILHLEEVCVQVIERRLLDNPILQKSSGEKILNHREATVAQYLFKFQNVRVDVLTGLIVLDSGFIVEATLAKWQKIIFRGGIGSAVKRTKKSTKKISGNFMVLPHSPFYYHTLIDELPNLIRIRDEYPHCNTVIVHKTTPRWALELLSYFEFKVNVLNEKAVIVESLCTVSAPRAIVKKNLEKLRQNVKTSPEKVIVVSRKGSPRSDNQIEQEILNRISGATLIDPGDFTVEEQVKIFSRARAIIGLHGGALANSIWMDQSGKLIEIFNHPYRTSDYETLCIELGIKYCGLETEFLNPSEIGLAIEGLLQDD